MIPFIALCAHYYCKELLPSQECHHFFTLSSAPLPLWPLNRKKCSSTHFFQNWSYLPRSGKWKLLCAGYQWIGLCVALSHPFTTLASEHIVCFCAHLSEATLPHKKRASVKWLCSVSFSVSPHSLMVTFNVTFTMWTSIVCYSWTVWCIYLKTDVRKYKHERLKDKSELDIMFIARFGVYIKYETRIIKSMQYKIE